MNDNRLKQIENGLRTSLIDSSVKSEISHRPQFIYNDNSKGMKVFTSIENELLKCNSFSISVAFITRGGITPLLQTFEELERRNVKGRILTTDYLCFSDPIALDKLSKLSNIELRMYCTDIAGIGFHTKGYIFQNDEEYHFIIGSSNLTQDALTKNMEWNTKFISSTNGLMSKDILEEFDNLWNDSSCVFEYKEIIDDYRKRYEEKQLIIKNQNSVQISFDKLYKLNPNSMQEAFIKNIKEMRGRGIDKALLISATGTGKTYASAFAMRECGFKRVLFLVHRNQIVKQAKTSFERVYSGKIKTGIVSGENRDYDADFVFATVQTLCKDENLEKFPKDYFDACIYDEAHHTTADSYRKVMDYFTPEFTLGMTATPDKRDDHIEGRNIYELYDHNIAYEIRLQRAMDEDLLCPFHYFGISDLFVVSDEGKTKKEKEENFRYLTCDDRVTHIIENANYYGHDGDRVKGLIFCSRIDEARELSKKFNERGLKTVALSGADSSEVRSKAIDLLTKEIHSKDEDYLDYIITVDIFSEGTDIVEVNQVIMLRPTQSPIVFVQQLGRGLRKSIEKEYVVILDFIGNYKNNFMIPIALSGDRTYNKDNIRKYVMEGSRVIPGSSTIHFDEVSRKKIFESIDTVKLNTIPFLKENYLNLKDKLGRVPSLKDFDDFGEMDATLFFSNDSIKSYYKFLVKYEKDYKVRLSDSEEKFVEFLSQKIADGKRIQELKIIERMIRYTEKVKYDIFKSLKDDLISDYNIEFKEYQKDNLVNILTNKFLTGTGKDTYSECIFIENNSEKSRFEISDKFSEMLKNKEFKSIINEIIEFGINRYRKEYANNYSDTSFVLYKKYTYDDVCRLLNWDNSIVPLNIGGYKFDKKTKTFPIFINYIKSDDINDSIRYEDRFTNQSTLIALSKAKRTLESEDVKTFLNADKLGVQNHLFIRKNKDDKMSKEFYYLGKVYPTGRAKEVLMDNTNEPAVEIEWKLDVPVREDLYDYFVEK